MFDLGFLELSLVAVVALIVIGPKQLPAVARRVARYVGQGRRIWQSVKQEAEQVIDEVSQNVEPESQQEEKKA